MKKLIARFIREEEGVTAIEYGLIAALIAVAIIATVTILGGTLSNTFEYISGSDGLSGVDGISEPAQ